jgi:enolase
MKKILFAIVLLLATTSNAQYDLKKIKNTISEKTKTTTSSKLSSEEIVKGLKEALSVGVKNAGSLTSSLDGFNKNDLIRIPFPESARKMETSLRKVGMGKKVDEFEVALNRAAEEASKEAAPIFFNSIKKMEVQDGLNILKGNDDAATQFMKGKTDAELYAIFKPIVIKALSAVNITKYWSPLVTRYNKIPLTKKMNPDLEDYTTKKTIEGLFKMLAIEEKKIRNSELARVTDILKKVFSE